MYCLCTRFHYHYEYFPISVQHLLWILGFSYLWCSYYYQDLPMKIFLTIKGLFPIGESYPPSIENPKPQLSLITSTVLAPDGRLSSEIYGIRLMFSRKLLELTDNTTFSSYHVPCFSCPFQDFTSAHFTGISRSNSAPTVDYVGFCRSTWNGTRISTSCAG